MPPAEPNEPTESYLVAYAEPSRENNPGHMVIGQETGLQSSYFGYRFDPIMLPVEFREPKLWRAYLFDNAVPGRIVNETGYVSHLRATGTRKFRQKRQRWTGLLEDHLPPPRDRDPYGFYSFNPDSDFPGKQPCYNCVKWAVEVGNRALAGFLSPVFQGRIKRILEQLQETVT